MEPKVFISYSHDNDAHKKWVEQLATNLMEKGIETMLDEWDLRIGDNIPKFMEQIKDYPYAICICSTKYTEKSNESKGGTGYEKDILADNILNEPGTVTVIPLLRNNKEEKLPTFLSGKNYINFNKDSDYLNKLSKLIERLYNFDKRKKPLLGKSLNLVDKDDWVTKKNLLEHTKFQNFSTKGSDSFDFSNNNGEFIIGTGDFSFSTKWSECGANTIYAISSGVKNIGYKSNATDFPSKEGLQSFDYTSRTRKVALGELVVWQNKHNHFAVTKITDIKVKSRGDTEDKLMFDYVVFSPRST